MDLIDPAMPNQAKRRPTLRRVVQPTMPKVVERDYTVTFFVDDIKPEKLPLFPYFVNGSAAGRVRMIAYVSADSPASAQYTLADYYPHAYVESIEPGRVEQVVPSVQGVSLPERRPGLFRRLLNL